MMSGAIVQDRQTNPCNRIQVSSKTNTRKQTNVHVIVTEKSGDACAILPDRKARFQSRQLNQVQG